MQKWIATGISGSGRIEFLEEIKKYGEEQNKNIIVHDVGRLIKRECERLNIDIKDDKILDVDINLLRALRASAIKDVRLEIEKNKEADLHLIGIHATFRWKGRLIPGISYVDILEIKPDGFINIVNDIKEIIETNNENPKWSKQDLPDTNETQDWMIEEEFVTQVLSEVTQKPIYIVSRKHHIYNIYDLFFTDKKKVYLSYPITAVQEDNPEMLEKIQTEYLEKLEDMFVVFNPLSIKDMELIGDGIEEEDIPKTLQELTLDAEEKIKTRTIERDYNFIDQSDYVVVFYLTDKLSPGVLGEIYYAHRTQKSVFIVYKHKISPFLEDATTHITDDIDDLFNYLEKIKNK